MEHKSLKQNLGFQTLYQIFNTCLPLITSPHLARSLGATQQGVFSYTQSIVNCFALFAMLGVANYGTRTMATCGENKAIRSKQFWSIYILQGACSIASIVLYLVYIFIFKPDNTIIVWIQGLYLVGCLADINWFFFGIEKFKTTVTRNMIIRTLSVVMILLYVNKPNDLWVYTAIMAGSTVISNGVLWLLISKEIKFKDLWTISIKEILAHVKPNITLFVPLLGMSIYHIMDKTMLGSLSSYEQVGYYYNADKIINIPMGIISGIGTVMLPRMTSLVSANHKDEAQSVFLISVEAVCAISCAMAFGIAAIANEFTPLFFGNGFDPCIILIIALSPVLIIKGLTQTSRMQYLIPNHKDQIIIQSVFIGATVNLAVNYVLISRLGAMGAVIGTLIAELVSCIWQYAKMSGCVKFTSIAIKPLIYVLFGFIMFIAVRLSAEFFCGGIIGILFEMLTGLLVYSGMCILFWKVTNSPILGFIKQKA